MDADDDDDDDEDNDDENDDDDDDNDDDDDDDDDDDGDDSGARFCLFAVDFISEPVNNTNAASAPCLNHPESRQIRATGVCAAKWHAQG